MIKILLLDDDELANELVVYIFEFTGVTDYHICTSGDKALDYLNKCSIDTSFPDVIFVDINMPGMNGFEFIEHYERNCMKYSPDTRVILLTNSVLANEKKQAMQLESVHDFWNKPLTQERLKKLIDSVVAES